MIARRFADRAPLRVEHCFSIRPALASAGTYRRVKQEPTLGSIHLTAALLNDEGTSLIASTCHRRRRITAGDRHACQIRDERFGGAAYMLCEGERVSPGGNLCVPLALIPGHEGACVTDEILSDFDVAGWIGEETPPEDSLSRRLLVVLLDISGSMGPQEGETGPFPIDELNSAFRGLLKGGKLRDSSLRTNGEVAIGAFWSVPKGNRLVSWEPKLSWVHLGTSVDHDEADLAIYWAAHASEWVKDDLPASGGTPLGFAVGKALETIRKRRQQWKDAGLTQEVRPALVVLTDGEPTDGEVVASVTPQVHAMEDSGELAFWIAGMRGANRQNLSTLADKGNFIELGDHALEKFVVLMSASVEVGGAQRTPEDRYVEVLKKLKWEDEQRDRGR